LSSEELGYRNIISDMQSLDASFFYLNYLFILFSLFGFRVRVRVISQSHYHTSVTLDDMVTVTVTSHKITEKDVKDSEKNDIIQHILHMLTLRQTHSH